MPIVYRSYKRKPWIVRWREPWSGRPRQRAFATETEAQGFEAAQVAVYERERVIIRAAKRRRAPVPAQRFSVSEIVERYLAQLGNPATRTTASYHARPFVDIYGQRRAHCLGVEDIAAFMDVQQRRGVSRNTACRRVAIIRTAYNWATKWGLLTSNPLAGLRLSSPAPQTPDPPTAAEARRIYAVAAPHVQRVIVLGMSLGARVGPSELFRICWVDVDLRDGTVRVPQAAKGARDEARTVPLSREALGLLKRWHSEDADSAPKHVINYKGRPVRSISRAWHNALRRAGITRRIRPYDLRHAFATRCLDHDADIKCVSEVMGHANQTMILRYYRHTSARQRRKAVNAAPPLGVG